MLLQGDAMTKQELAHFKQHISKVLDIGGPNCGVYTFLPEDIQEAGEWQEASVRCKKSSGVCYSEKGCLSHAQY